MPNNHLGDAAKSGLLATGGVLAALGASSCCALPVVFALAGVGGAWISTFTKLAPYQPVFLAIAALCVGTGLWRAYRTKSSACDGAKCATPASHQLTTAALWLGAILIAAAGSTEWWIQFLV